MKRVELLKLMTTLDDAWNAGPGSKLWEMFRKRHTEDVAVYWPGGAPATRGRRNHDLEAREFFKTFPDNHLINRPYKILFADGKQTCSVAQFRGTMKGPMNRTFCATRVKVLLRTADLQEVATAEPASPREIRPDG